MPSLRPAATVVTLVIAAGVLGAPSTASARPCVGEVCVPNASDVLYQFCSIADGPIVEIVCSLG